MGFRAACAAYGSEGRLGQAIADTKQLIGPHIVLKFLIVTFRTPAFQVVPSCRQLFSTGFVVWWKRLRNRQPASGWERQRD